MKTDNSHRQIRCQRRNGVVLLVMLAMLVILASVSYALSVRVSAQCHRNQYIIDYSSARYGCESAVKYAVTCLEDVNETVFIERPDEPDFSDLFALNESQYRDFLAAWAADRNSYIDVNSMTVRGPYGPQWPLVTEPMEIMIGSAKVTIEIEDENAKYPVGWTMLEDEQIQRETRAGFATFCEWMGIDERQINSFEKQFEKLREIKPFKLDLQPIVVSERKVTTVTRGERRRVIRRTTIQKTTIPSSVHTADFAKLYHSSLIDTETLAKPAVVSDNRNESALKYTGLWGCGQVNINTAPRQVLEAAFMFGGDSVAIAEKIIQQRRIKPFSDINELKAELSRYSTSIQKCEKYITTRSNFFTVRITAVSGVAKATIVVAVRKESGKIETIGIISS